MRSGGGAPFGWRARLARWLLPNAPVARYDAAGMGRRLRGWLAPGSGPNRATEGAQTLRNRARDAVRNDWAAAAGARTWAVNLVGTGIVPQPKTQDPALKARLVALWDAWAAVADADGVLDFYGLQTLAVRSWVVSGEVFVRLRPRLPEDGLPVPLQVQLLEADMVPAFDADAWPGLPDGHRIRSGIELDALGRRVAYWMYREHPGERQSGDVPAGSLTRVPAAVVRHMYEPQRPGQLRGVSDFAPVLARLRGVMDYDDAVLERQKLANLFTLFITRPAFAPEQLVGAGNGIMTAQEMIDLYSAPLEAGLGPGTAHELLPGEDVRFSSPPDAGSTYGEFMRYQHLGVAAGQGMPYEVMSGDIRDVSDRTLRVVINEFRRHCEQRQWQVIIPMLCQPVRDAWADAAWIAGLLDDQSRAAAKAVRWRPQAWPYIHPVQDREGKRLDLEMGLRSRAAIIGEMGDDPEDVDAERAEDLRRELRLKLREPVAEARTVARADAGEVSALRARVEAILAAQQVTRQAPVVQPVVNVQPAPVNVQNVMPEPSAPVVNVQNVVPDSAAPVVNVQNVVPSPVVQVDAPEVRVENVVQPAPIGDVRIVGMPAREMTTEIERDAGKNIVRSVQIERDLVVTGDGGGQVQGDTAR